ncbi:MAG: hypothetical protein J6328_01600 [Bacilli bacterium]|nr:hypothetical protein [Bacilli bacterium]
MNKKQLTVILLSAALLASCTNPGEKSSIAPDSTPGSSLIPTPSSSKPVSTYQIVDRTGDGVSITLSKTEAAKGETITVTVAVAEGFILDSLLVNGEACTKVNETTYTFLMPDTSAVITSKLTVTGEAVVTGDLAARLEKQSDGTFKGTLTANVNAKIAVKVGSVTYGYGAVNFDRSFGDIGDASASGFRVSGNAIYEITFDVSLGQSPIVVKRIGFVHAPKSADDLASAFNGDYSGRNVNDGGAYNINNLKKATYRNTRTAIQYEWNRYAGDVSYASAKNILTDETDFVYKKLSGTHYKVVDTYVESGRDNSGVYWDDTMREDTTAYSADYAVVENVENKNYQIDAFSAKRDIITPSHNMHSVDRDMHYGYRTGFAVEDDVKAVSRVFNGVENEDGTYTTTVASWKNFQDSNATRTRSSYQISVTFNADSTIKSGSYIEYFFNESNWKFNDNDVDNGGSAIGNKSGTLITKAEFSYEYGDSYSAAPSFDETPYFISSITSAEVTSKGLEANHIQQNEIVDDWRDPQRDSIENDSYGYSSIVNISYAPATALNRWQYGVSASSDERVVGPRVNGSYGWQALRIGTSTLTIDGHTPGTPSVQVEVSVENGIQPKNYYFMDALGHENDFVDATHVQVRAGSTAAVRLVIQPVDANYNPTITTSNPNLKVTLDEDYDTSKSAYYTGKILHIDATAMNNTAKEEVTLFISDDFDPSYRVGGSSFVLDELKVVVNPKPASGLWPTSLAGTTWSSSRALTEEADSLYEDATIAFTDEDITISQATYKKAILNVTSGKEKISDYEMGYVYDPLACTLSFKGTLRSGWFAANIATRVDATAGTFGFAFTYEVMGGWDEDLAQHDVIGMVCSPEDEETYGYETGYVTFTKNA